MNDNFYILIIIGIAGIAMIITGFILLQVRNQNKLLRQQKQIAAVEILHQKTLLEAVITSQETERQRIGSDLHDEVGAVLSSLRMLIEKHGVADTAASEDGFTIQSKTIIDRVIKNVRQIAHNLSPHINGDFGFYDAVHELCDTVRKSGMTGLSLDFKEEHLPVHLNGNTAMAVYRILAELINNTIRHARAGNIKIGIFAGHDDMQISYADDGIGFPADNKSSKGMGLQNIESRLNMIGANWTIAHESSHGFSMNISFPVK